VAFVIVSRSAGDFSTAGSHHQVVGRLTGHGAGSLDLELRVEALVGLIGLESQGHSCEPHPIVGGAVHPSCGVVFGRWVTYWSSPPSGAALSAQRGVGWHLSGRGHSCALSPSGMSGACLLLSEQAYLVELDLSPFNPEVGTEKRSCGAALREVNGEGRGHGRPLDLVLGPGLHGIDGPRLLGFVLARLSWAARAAN
jgi:hypothetical protein